MRKQYILTALLCLLLSATAFAQGETISKTSDKTPMGFERVDPIAWNIRVGAGAALAPSIFWLTGQAEVQLDKFFALGPTVQLGLGDLTTYTFASFGPRFTLPFYYFEWFLGASAGLAYRDQANVGFTNFLYEVNTGFEFYVMKNISLGAAIRRNWISSNAVSGLSVATGYLSGHF